MYYSVYCLFVTKPIIYPISSPSQNNQTDPQPHFIHRIPLPFLSSFLPLNSQGTHASTQTASERGFTNSGAHSSNTPLFHISRLKSVMSIRSEEVNYLVYRYLQESGMPSRFPIHSRRISAHSIRLCIRKHDCGYQSV